MLPLPRDALDGVYVVSKAKGAGHGGRHGGRRTGAGAPKGNKNAVRHGERSRDVKFETMWRSLTPEQQEYFRPLVRKAGHLLESEALTPGPSPSGRGEDSSGEEGEKVRAIWEGRRPAPSSNSPLYPHTHSQQSNNQRERARELALIQVCVGKGCFNAQPFVEKHPLDVIEGVLEEMRVLEENAPEQYQAIASPGAMIRAMVHERVMVRRGRLFQCPYCAARQYVMVDVLDAEDVGG